MSYKLDFSTTALEDIKKHRKAGDKAILRKIEKLLNELVEHLTNGTGHPELLKHGFVSLYSRRINKKHRLVYSVSETVTVHVLNAWSNYGDK